MNKRVDSVMHKNTYNTSVNKKLNLQEDIEKLEEQLLALEELVPKLTKDGEALILKNDLLQEEHKRLVYKKSTEYDGWEEDLKGFEEEMEKVVSNISRWAYATKQKSVTEGRASPFTDIYYLTSISDICSKYPKIVVKSEELVKGSETLKQLKNSLEVIVPELESQLETTRELELRMKKKEEVYTKYLSEERKTGKWYFLAGCLVATTITLLLK
jgi:DNA repair exonuclease SbcCD ATPase subunit